ncbi:hypothetical protein ACTHQF_06605 [Pedobacter sp. SAFR-022]|uniref:hypothetical protein n=1 Tax=Pedobacter sp. SAFR-022 TaxID=3436861 RepID=UPI003F7FE026
MTPQQKFTIYIRTKQVFSLRLRTEFDDLQPVHIPSKEIEERFFTFPDFKRKDEILALVISGELRVTEKDKRFFYEALKPGKIDLSLLLTKPLPEDPIYKVILNHLKSVSLPPGAASTDYFDLFLKYQQDRPELFFKVDEFAGRVHSPVSNFHRSHRPYLLLDGEQTTSLDVACMQPTLLGKILREAIPGNEYSGWINSGKDIYVELQTKARLETRDEAKKKFFEILFSKPSNALSNLFGAADWITWINLYKATPQTLNPHGKDKPHSNLAWLLQTTEVKVMAQIWRKLIAAEIIFVPVHDEIIIPISKAEQARVIMSQVLSNEFVYFKISGDKLNKDFSTVTTRVKDPAPSRIPDELAELQKYYSDLESRGDIPDKHRNYIGSLWQGVQLTLPTNHLSLSLYTDALEQLKSELLTNKHIAA